MSQKVVKSKNKKVTFFNIFSKMSPKYIIYKNLCSAQKNICLVKESHRT